MPAETQPAVTTDEGRERTGSNRCSFCRIKGHSIEKCFKKKKAQEQQIYLANQQLMQKPEMIRKPIYSCYGCGAPRVYRSSCPTCSRNLNVSTSPQNLTFNSIMSSVIGHSLPTTLIYILGLKGEAIFDCGAKN